MRIHLPGRRLALCVQAQHIRSCAVARISRQGCYGSRHMSRRSPIVFIMAAGLGTRMKSDLPKVLHCIAGRPMLHWVVTAARAAGAGRVIAILGHRADAVKAALDASFGGNAVEVVLQTE